MYYHYIIEICRLTYQFFILLVYQKNSEKYIIIFSVVQKITLGKNVIQNYVTMQAFVRMEVHVSSTTTVPKSANVPQDIQVSPSKSNPGICIDQILAENQKKYFFPQQDINVNKNNPPLHVQTIARIMVRN